MNLQCQGIILELISNTGHLELSVLLTGLQLVFELLDSGASLGQFHQALLHFFPSSLQQQSHAGLCMKSYQLQIPGKKKEMIMVRSRFYVSGHNV